MKKKKLILSIIGAVAVLGGTVGIVGALSGWFGGGGSIPSDTFTRGLAGYWSLDEGSGGMAYDASGNANHGTTSGGPGWTTGKVGGALSFDGVDDYVDAGNDANLDITGAITVEAWINSAIGETGADYPLIAGKRTGFLGYGLHVQKYTTPQFWIGDGSDWVGASAGAVVSPNQWYHLVGTYDGSNLIKIYVNGVLKNTGSQQSLASSGTKEFRIGLESAIRQWNGLIDDVRIYNRALSAEEVRYHYNRGGPVAHWKMDEGSGSTAYDSTENDNDGTLYGEMATSTTHGWVEGKYGSALSFDGVNDYVNCGNIVGLDVADLNITIGAWVKTNVTAPDTDVGMRIFTTYRASDSSRFSVGMRANKAFSYVNPAGGEFLGTSDINDGNWHYIVTTYNGVTQKLYVDAVEENSRNFDLVDEFFSQVDVIGAFHSTDGFWNGYIDDLRIYGYARTPEQIRQDYNAGLSAHFR
jgi:hypothetical protein